MVVVLCCVVLGCVALCCVVLCWVGLRWVVVGVGCVVVVVGYGIESNISNRME